MDASSIFACWLSSTDSQIALQSLSCAWIHIYPPSTLPFVHKQHQRCSMSERERLVIALLPQGLMTPRKPNRSWWCDRAEEGGAHHSPLPFCSFTTLQNSLLICCSVWGVWIVPASITIITSGGRGHSVPWALSLNGPSGRSLSVLSPRISPLLAPHTPYSLVQTMQCCLNPMLAALGAAAAVIFTSSRVHEMTVSLLRHSFDKSRIIFHWCSVK